MYDDVFYTRQGFIIPDEHIPSEDDMKRYAESDNSVTDILIEGLMGYVVSSVDWFLSITPTARPFSEDCRSEALFSLTEFVYDNLGRTYRPHAFMSVVKIRTLSDVKDWLQEHSITVTIPARTRRLNKLNMNQHILNDWHQVTPKEEVFSSVWNKEFLEMLDNFDLRLVRLKMGGLSDREISKELGIDHQHVGNHLKRLAYLYTEGEEK